MTDKANPESEREQFEKWLRTTDCRLVYPNRRSPNEYVHPGLQSYWLAWQARAALKAPPAPTEVQGATVSVERGGVYIVRGVQSFRLAYEGETRAEQEWYASQLRKALQSSGNTGELAQGDRHEPQAEGKHPAPCARHCEATAFGIEIRRLEAENAGLRTAQGEDSARLDGSKP